MRVSSRSVHFCCTRKNRWILHPKVSFPAKVMYTILGICPEELFILPSLSFIGNMVARHNGESHCHSERSEESLVS